MTNNVPTTDQSSREPEVQRRSNTLVVTGGILWVLCFVGIAFGWYQWRQKNLVREGAATVGETESGRNVKQIKLVPQKDGGIDLKEVTTEEESNPWDAEGIEDFSFTDTNGQSLTKKDLLGKPFIIAFVFTLCRGPCPNVTLQMRELQNVLKDYDFNLVTLTVDPARDDVETLQKYGQDNGANFDRWKFLTGNQADIYGLIHRSFKMPVEEAKGPARQPGFEIIHSTNIMLVDETGRVVGKYNAQKEEEMAKLKREIRRIAKAKTEAKNGKEGQQ